MFFKKKNVEKYRVDFNSHFNGKLLKGNLARLIFYPDSFRHVKSKTAQHVKKATWVAEGAIMVISRSTL